MIRAAQVAPVRGVGTLCGIVCLACVSIVPAAIDPGAANDPASPAFRRPSVSIGNAGLINTPQQSGASKLAQQILKATGVEGGLIVHLGCGDGTLTIALHAGESYLVHGLDADPRNVARARASIRACGLYGPVSVEQFDGRHLPYADDIVNLVVADELGQVPTDEVLRVLAPRGVAYVKRGASWEKTVKAWPAQIDQWTHWLHDAGNNAVAGDTRVGPPRRMQWVAAPLWSRGHELASSVGAVVTAGGRIFYALDEGQPGIYALPSKWSLVARDAFNGVSLWKRAIPGWGPPLSSGGFTHGFHPRRLATDGDRVYLSLGLEATLAVLDAASGRTLKTLDAARGTAEILCADRLLVAVAGIRDDAAKRKGMPPGPGPSLLAFSTDSLQLLWKMPVAGLVAQTAALAAGRVFYKAGERVVALDARTGRQAWQTPLEIQPGKKPRRPGAALLMVHERTVYFHSGSRLAALSAAAGKLLWERNDAPSAQGELFAAAGFLWRTAGQQVIGHDPASGEVRRTIDASGVFTRGHHPRCYPCKATERYLLTNNRGAEFVSLTSDEQVENDWLRGNCGHGVVPANGLLYAPPSPCFCYPGARLTGFNCLAPAAAPASITPENPVERGPAWDSLLQSPIPNPQSPSHDWPTYRHDAARTGATGTAVPPPVSLRWTAAVGGRLTAPVVCGGRVYVAAKDQHTLAALAVDDGRPLWQFTAGGRIDSPPTVYGELVLFGSADGYVYGVRAGDGQLAWRFRAAPAERRIVAFGQLESAWRVHGSVLLVDGIAYCTAGRSSFLDGGIWLYGLDPQTGQIRCQSRLDTWAPTRVDAVGKPFVPAYHIEGALSDVLVSQGGSIFLGQYQFDAQLRQQPAPYILPDDRHKTTAMDLAGQPFTAGNEEPGRDYEAHQREWIERTQKDLVAGLRASHGSFGYGARRMGLHLLATSGMLDDTWFNRTYWMYSAVWPGFYIDHRGAKSGQLLVVGPAQTYSVQAYPSRNLQCPLFTPAEKGYLLVADANQNEPVLDDATFEVTKGWGFTRAKPPAWFDWVPIRIRAMVLAGQTLFVAGPPDVMEPGDPYAAFEGRRGGLLRALSATEGRQLAELPLDGVPVFDGLAAAGGQLFLATVDGRVLCFAPRGPKP